VSFLVEERFASAQKLFSFALKIDIYNCYKSPHKTVTEFYANNIVRHLFTRYIYNYYGFKAKF